MASEGEGKGTFLDQGITTRHLVVFFGALSACLTIIAFFHSKMVLPQVMQEVMGLVETEMAKHEARPHLQSATREDVRDIRTEMQKLATKDDIKHLSERMRRIEAILDSRNGD